MALKNKKLNKAKKAKNDEFYTQYRDIETEITEYHNHDKNVFHGKTILLPCDDPKDSKFTEFLALNYEDFGIKKIISTSYNPGGHGTLYILDRDTNGDGRINWDDIEVQELEGDGDFRSDEVKALRDEADIIITNPPFSLAIAFLHWIIEADKKFLFIANKGFVSCKTVFPLIHDGKIWAGVRPWAGGMKFELPADAEKWDEIRADGVKIAGVASAWFTNIDHGRRHEPLNLSTTERNLRDRSKLKGKTAYDTCDNYDALFVPEVVMIPSDYAGVMAVPTTFVDKYCPEQFEILGITENGENVPSAVLRKPGHAKYDRPYVDGARKWPLIFIRHTEKSLRGEL